MAWLPAVATIFSSILGSEGQENTNDTNLQIQQNNSAFNAQQAQLARDFNAEQGAMAREFAGNEAATARNFNADEARINRAFSAEQADKQMLFQEEMASTQWQRAMSDMQAAGLNPMLAYRQGGNAAPAGSMAQTSAASGPAASTSAVSGPAASAGHPGNALNPFASAAASAGQWASIDNVMADTERKRAETKNIEAEHPHIDERREVTRSERTRLETVIRNISQDTELKIATKYRIIEEINQVKAQVDKIGAEEARTRILTILDKHDIPRMEAESKYFRSPVGGSSPHNKYGPQTPFRLLEGLGERVINKWSARE